MTAPRLALHGVAVARGGVRVLEGVSFTLGPGQALILRGPNGIGKSTLLRAIAGLQPPAAGRIDLPDDSAAYAGHADGLKPTLTAAENLGFWRAVFGGAGKVADALAALDLGSLADRPAGTLSAGQKRRLGLARLLVTGRPLWLLDEPATSLDAASVAQLEALLRAHLAAGGAAVIASHTDLDLPGAATLGLVAHRPRRAEASPFDDEAFA